MGFTRRGGRVPPSLAQRLDAFWLMVGEGLGYHQTARVLTISRSEVGASIY
jgi:hypothetical protein